MSYSKEIRDFELESRSLADLPGYGKYYPLTIFANNIRQMLYLTDTDIIDRMAAMYEGSPIRDFYELPILKFTKTEKGKYPQLKFTHQYSIKIPRNASFALPVRHAFGIGIFLIIFFTFSYLLA